MNSIRNMLGALALALSLVMTASAARAGAIVDNADTAVNAGSLNTLVAALKAAGLMDTQRDEGSFAVFTPIDSATKVPERTLESFLKPTNKSKVRPGPGSQLCRPI